MTNGNVPISGDHLRYRPTVLCGGWRRGNQEGVWDYTGYPWCSIWWLFEGTIQLRRSDGQTQRLNAPTAIFLQSPDQSQLSIAVSAKLHWLEFDVLTRHLIQRSGGQAHGRKPAIMANQPPAEEVWGVSIPQVLPEALHDLTRHCLVTCCSQWWRGPSGMAIADGTLAAYLGRVVDHCAGHHSEGAREASGSDWFERAKAIGLERVLAPFSVQAWAERMGLSRQHFSRRFKEASGESPADWFNRLKIGKVLELLQRPDYRQRSLADIARRCGFASQEVLGRFVKRHSGLLPSEIRSGGQRQRQGAMSSP